MVIPSNISYNHITSALEEIRHQDIPPVYQYRRYALEYEGKRYPPRYAISIANKYANGSILEHSQIGSQEAISFLRSMRFNILDLSYEESIGNSSYIPVTDKAPEVQNYLENTYSISVNKAKGFRSGLVLPSGAIIHVSGSKQYPDGGGFYALTFNKYKDIESNANAYYAIVLDKPENTFLLPQIKVKQIFSGLNPGEDKRWPYNIRKEDEHYILLPTNDTRNIDDTHYIETYLNKWDQIEDLKNTPAQLSSSGQKNKSITPLANFEKKKNFVDLQRFILKEMRMQANYQPVLIRTLLESENQRANKDVIAKKIEEMNPNEPSSHFNTIPVYDVLENHGIIKREPNNKFVLNSEELASDLQLEELIAAFDKNRRLFEPERLSDQEREDIRLKFVSLFPPDKIQAFQLDEYVIGKPDPVTGRSNKHTFCYGIEEGLPGFGGVGGTPAGKYGIFYSNEQKNTSTMTQNMDQPRQHLLQ